MASTTALQLKDEGNAFFGKKDFKNAHKKYTEAIALDGQNAVLYANRSACSFGMGKYVDASRDARKATEIEPGYAKGWSRRASADEALLDWKSCVESWEKALDALPKTDLSPAELKQKEQYSASLQSAKRRLEELASTPTPAIIMSSSEKLPWQMAAEMIPELEAMGPAGYTSSAWVIHRAYEDFMEGVGFMKNLKRINVPGSPKGYGFLGHLGALTSISNGAMRDSRVLHMDSSDWIKRYNEQVMFEAERHQAWLSENLDAIKRQALERQGKKGWDDVRPALAVTVRAWVMRAIFDHSLRGAPHVSVELLKQAIDLLEWGRETWKDVPRDDRGTIFDATFARGVRAIYLEALMEAYAKGPGADKEAILETLYKEATHALEEASNSPRASEPADPGFVSSFYVYPIGQAQAMLGFYFAQKAQSSNEPQPFLLLAGKKYTEAAMAYPPDDEYHCFYMQAAIEHMLSGQVPLHLIEPLANFLREATPRMQRIWANSALARQGRDSMIQKTLRAVEERSRS